LSLGELILGEKKDCINNDCLPTPQTIDVEEVIIHPDWKPRDFYKGNDIALVRLAELAVLNYVNICKYIFE